MRKDLNPNSWVWTFHCLPRRHWNRIPQDEDVKFFISKVEMWRNVHKIIKEVFPLYKINKHTYFYFI